MKKISKIEYFWICISQGWRNFSYSFHIWSDLMRNNFDNYAILKEDNPFECCLEYFWDSLEEEVYEKEFLEYLHQLVDDVMTGKVETVAMTIEDLEEDLLKDNL